jgi:hypothetical protein
VAFLFAILVFGGYLVPLPAAGMAWREWIVSRKTRIKTWRNSATLAALVLTTAVIPLWAYAVVRESRNDYSYVFASAPRTMVLSSADSNFGFRQRKS